MFRVSEAGPSGSQMGMDGQVSGSNGTHRVRMPGWTLFTALLNSLYKTLSDTSLHLDVASEQWSFLYLRNTKNFVTNPGLLICHLRLDRGHLDYIEIAIVHTLIHLQIHAPEVLRHSTYDTS